MPISTAAGVKAFLADGATQLPDDDGCGEERDHRVQAEPDQRDGRGEDP
jgi:hypothetical protein